jgi:hypothetical protein
MKMVFFTRYRIKAGKPARDNMKGTTPPPDEIPPLPAGQTPAWYGRALIALGGPASQAGWILLAMGSAFLWTTSLQSEIRYLFQEKFTDWQVVAGVVLQAEATGFRQAGKDIWRYRHSFALDDGHRYRGNSYSVGPKFDAGQVAYIKYDPGLPQNNYIVGLRRSRHRAAVNLLLLFPLAGLLLVGLTLPRNLRNLQLVSKGVFAKGKLESKVLTSNALRAGARVLPVYKYSFFFDVQQVIYYATCHTHEGWRVEDEREESILYLPSNPTVNAVYDAIPNAPPLEQDGRPGDPPVKKAWLLLFPAFVFWLNLLFACLSF